MVDYMIAGFSLGMILAVLALIDFFFTKGTLVSVLTIPIKKLTGITIAPLYGMIALFVIGVLMVGGISAFWGLTGGKVLGVAGITEPTGEQADIITGNCIVDKARYVGATVGHADIDANTTDGANMTFSADTSNENRYFIDSKNVSLPIQGGVDVNTSIKLWLKKAPTTGSECNVLVYAIAPSYKDMISTGANADDIYDLNDGARTTSALSGLPVSSNRVDTITWKQNIYIADNAYATTSSTQEIGVVNFAAGELTNNVGMAFDWDSTAYSKITKNEQLDWIVKQQMGDNPSSSDPTLFIWTLRKGSLGE